MEPKVLIGVITYSGQKYCFFDFINAIKKQDYPNFDLWFIDNSDSDEYFEFLKEQKINAIRNKIDGGRFEKILSSRSLLRKLFLEKKEYDYLFMVDSDIVLQKDALTKLVNTNKDLVSGVYIVARRLKIKNKIGMSPVVFEYINEEQGRWMKIKETIDEKIFPIACAGLGITLAKKEVLEKIDFRLLPSGAGEDIAFYVDARKAGFEAVCNSAVKGLHLPYPLGDPRIKLYDWEEYRRKLKEREEKRKKAPS